MKLGLYADPHFSQSSSIIVGHGKEKDSKFSAYLTRLIESFRWMNDLFENEKVDKIVCLGDLVDKSSLSAEEITALSECNLSNHYMLIGNHCRADQAGYFNSLAVFPHVIDKPQFLDGCDNVYLLPYNSQLVDLDEIEFPAGKKRIILSHNDIYGYDMGYSHLSEVGYNQADIVRNCDLYINGHLHDGEWLTVDRVMNLGSITGMNFASINRKWKPSVAILDTETAEIQLYENPEAFNFYKKEVDGLAKLKKYLDTLDGNYNVIQIKIPRKYADDARTLINQYSDKVYASRVLTINDTTEIMKNEVEELEIANESIYEKLKKFISLQDDIKCDVDELNKLIDELALMEEGAD